MKTWKIVSSAGVDMGTYEGETREDALDAMARDAGYTSRADTPEPFDGTVTEVGAAITDEQIEALRSEAVAAGDRLMVAVCDVALATELGAEIPESVDGHWAALKAMGIHPAMRVGPNAADVRARAECARVLAEAGVQS